MARRGARQINIVQRVPAPEPQPVISPGSSRRAQVRQFGAPGTQIANEPETPSRSTGEPPESLRRLIEFASTPGDISHLLEPGIIGRIGEEAVREWEIDTGSITDWTRITEEGLAQAAQESDEQEGDGTGKNYPFENASDIHAPLLTIASQEFAALADAELVKGDQVVGFRAFQPGPTGQPSDPQQLQQQDQATQLKEARGKRLSHFINWLIFYKMENWFGENDALFCETSVSGAGFKKVYMDPENGLTSDYVSALRLTVNNATKSLRRCPRITHDFDVYPYEIDQRRRSGRYRDVELPVEGQDPETMRLFIEQYRMEDLDEDGLSEPYIVTVDTVTHQVMRIEAGYGVPDIVMKDEQSSRVVRIERWLPFPTFRFLPDSRGGFYGTGFARLLRSTLDGIDTSFNQLMDAGNAEIAGGGFIGANVRLQGSGQGGALYVQPGEYAVVSTPGPDLQQSIWERTVPHPSDVTFKLLELLLDFGKGIASIKDVATGDTPTTAPVGTTLAVQSQALRLPTSIWRRMLRGFREEFWLMYEALKRWGREEDKRDYAKLTGGNWHEDFTGDGTDIQPVADPALITRMQKISRLQGGIQLAESPVGMAAGMTQPGPAQELVKEALDAMGYENPERFVAPVPPNPLEAAKTQDLTATAQLKGADAHLRLVESGEVGAKSNLANAKALRETGLAAQDTHRLHLEANDIAKHGTETPKSEGLAQCPGPAHRPQPHRPASPPAFPSRHPRRGDLGHFPRRNGDG